MNNVYSNTGALVGAHRDELEAVADALAAARASNDGYYVVAHDGVVIIIAATPSVRRHALESQ